MGKNRIQEEIEQHDVEIKWVREQMNLIAVSNGIKPVHKMTFSRWIWNNQDQQPTLPYVVIIASILECQVEDLIELKL